MFENRAISDGTTTQDFSWIVSASTIAPPEHPECRWWKKFDWWKDYNKWLNEISRRQGMSNNRRFIQSLSKSGLKRFRTELGRIRFHQKNFGDNDKYGFRDRRCL